jgi:hypothetical protein
MKSFRKALLYGLLVWVIPFVVAIFIFPLRNNERPLFESIMPVVLTLATVLFSVLYFKKVDKNFVKEGLLLGILFFAVSLAIDLLMFMQGPMKMAFVDYMKDIGITYLLIPIITVGFGYLLEKRKK